KSAVRAKLQPLLDLLKDPDPEKLGTLHEQVDTLGKTLEGVDTHLQDLVDDEGNLKHPILDATASNAFIGVETVTAVLGIWRAGLDIRAFREGDMRAFVSLFTSGPDAVDAAAGAANDIRHLIIGKDSATLGDISKFAAQVGAGVGIIMSS